MKVLHITSWYPTTKNPKTALWVYRHIDALAACHVKNTVYHVEVSQDRFDFSFGEKEIHGNRSYRICAKFLPWFILELFAFIFVLWVIWKERKSNYDIINFHIAYPNLIYWDWLQKFSDCPLVVTEHWSAYHFHFGIKNSPKLNSIKKIFTRPKKIITVSTALSEDIARFTGIAHLPFAVIPNVVDTRIFYYEKRTQTNVTFFMVSQWKYPKDPFTVITVFAEFCKKVPSAILRIAGYGPQESKILEHIQSLKLGNNVEYVGKLESWEIAEEMRMASAFIHASKYETFSVVCAESICCGCPVIAPPIGGIPEFIDNTNGLFYTNEQELLTAMERSLVPINRHAVAQQAGSRFSPLVVGAQYHRILADVAKPLG